MTLSRSSRPIVRGYHSSSQAAVTSSTSLARDSLATSTTARGSSTSATTRELGHVGREVAPGEVEVGLVAGEHHPGQTLAPGAQGVHDGAVDGHRDPGEDDHGDQVGDGERQRPADERPALAEQAAQGEVEQGDEAARGQRQPGRPGQHGRPAEPGLALVEPPEVEGEDEDQGGDAEREQVGAQRVRRPRRGAVAHHHAEHRQPEDRQRVEQHDEPEAAPVEPSEQRGDGPPLGARVGSPAPASQPRAAPGRG